MPTAVNDTLDICTSQELCEEIHVKLTNNSNGKALEVVIGFLAAL